MKTKVHMSVHRDARGQKMVKLEEISVCMCAWMHISRIPQATFYKYQAYARANQEASKHGNTGLAKPRKHTQLATATLIVSWRRKQITCRIVPALQNPGRRWCL